MVLPSSEIWLIHPHPRPNFQWGSVHRGSIHQCPHCLIPLLTGEKPGFCCGPHGSRLTDVPSLPPFPHDFDIFITHPDVSANSHILNLIFSFASTECTAEFPSFRGPPGFFVVHGWLYHRVRPTHQNSAVCWLLYDGFLADKAPHQDWMKVLPPEWICAVSEALLRINPFVRSLRQLSLIEPSPCVNYL